jgi:hypothetical protein
VLCALALQLLRARHQHLLAMVISLACLLHRDPFRASCRPASRRLLLRAPLHGCAAWPPPHPCRPPNAVTSTNATHLAGTWHHALVVQVLTDVTLSGTGTRTRHTMSLTFSSPWSQTTTTTTATPLPRWSTHHQRRSRHRVPSRRGSFRHSACFGGQFGRVGVMAYAWEE